MSQQLDNNTKCLTQDGREMASEHHARSSTHSKKYGENGHATLSNRLSREEYNELRGNGTSEQGSDKISGPFEGNSG